MANGPITLTVKGDFKKSEQFIQKWLEKIKFGNLDAYGRKGVEALRAATPKDTGLASECWTYVINRSSGLTTLEWHNTDIEHGFHVIIGIQYGHATKSGGWVEGYDFINPAIQPIFDEIQRDLAKGVNL